MSRYTEAERLVSRLSPSRHNSQVESSLPEMASSDLLHLHPLSFPASVAALPSLSSTQLALVAFHPDADATLINRARIAWHKRRAAALERGEKPITTVYAPQPSASAAPLPSAASASSHLLRSVPPQFDHLVRVLAALYRKGDTRPLRSQVGTTLRGGRVNLYGQPGMPRDFKAYCFEAERLGIVNLSNTGQMNGREWIALAQEVRSFAVKEEEGSVIGRG
jgi:hypothetical protein